MKKAGVVLIIIQAVAVLSGIISGSFINMLKSCTNTMGIITLIGFLLPGIIGIILFVKGNKKSKRE